MEKLILRNTQSPGDYIVLSAAIRDLHKAYPGRFLVGVDVPERTIFQGNPHVDLGLRGGGRKLVAKYPLIKSSNQERLHFLWGFVKYLNEQLHIPFPLTELRPDLHLTAEEKANPPLGAVKPYWVMVSGGKRDFTAKWWLPDSWQQVVNALNKRFEIVQVGGGSHVHPVLSGVRNLVGKTSFRELMRLIYHSDGVLCIVTCLMHIAAAFNKPCVVVAGGREPWWWEGYTQENRLFNLRHGIPGWNPPANDDYVAHRYLHTLNQLPCCMNKGCWKTKIEPQRDSCQAPSIVGGRRIPRCMEAITAEHVVRAVESYYNKQPFQNLVEIPKTAKAVPQPPVEVRMQPELVVPQPVELPTPEPILAGIRVCLYLGQVVSPLTYLRLLKDRRNDGGELMILSSNTSPELEDWCLAERASLIRCEDRATAMTKVMRGNEHKWTAWLEYPWLPKSKNLWDQLLRKAGGKRCVMGLVYWQRITQDMTATFRRAPWNRNVEFTPMTLVHGSYRTFHPGPGFWLAPTPFLQDIKFEQWARTADPEVSLGEALHQNAVPLYEVGTLVLRL
jgi:ADP-heptose:LPS heptosyltransferase